MYDADESEIVINEFLVALVLPGVLLFVALWASFGLRLSAVSHSRMPPPRGGEHLVTVTADSLVFDEFLRSLGLGPIVPAAGPTAI